MYCQLTIRDFEETISLGLNLTQAYNGIDPQSKLVDWKYF